MPKQLLAWAALAAMALAGQVRARAPGGRGYTPPPPPPPPAYKPPPPPPPPAYKPSPAPAWKPAPAPSYKPAPAPSYKPSPAPAWKPTPAPSYKPSPAPAWKPAPSAPAPASKPSAPSASSGTRPPLRVIKNPDPRPAAPARPSLSVLPGGRSGSASTPAASSAGSRPALRVVKNPNPPATPTPRPKPARIPAAVEKEHARERAAFRRDVFRKVDDKHPLKFLLEKDKEGKRVNPFDAGRITHKRAGSEILGVEHPKLNRGAGGKTESLGIGPVRKYVDVGGIPVEKRSADLWLKEGKLKKEDIKGPHPGWTRK